MALVRLANTFWQARGWLLANSSLAVSFEIFSLGLALPSLLLLSGNTLTGLNLGHTANPSGLRVRAILARKTSIYRSTTILFIMHLFSSKKINRRIFLEKMKNDGFKVVTIAPGMKFRIL